MVGSSTDSPNQTSSSIASIRSSPLSFHRSIRDREPTVRTVSSRDIGSMARPQSSLQPSATFENASFARSGAGDGEKRGRALLSRQRSSKLQIPPTPDADVSSRNPSPLSQTQLLDDSSLPAVSTTQSVSPLRASQRIPITANAENQREYSFDHSIASSPPLSAGGKLASIQSTKSLSSLTMFPNLRSFLAPANIEVGPKSPKNVTRSGVDVVDEEEDWEGKDGWDL